MPPGNRPVRGPAKLLRVTAARVGPPLPGSRVPVVVPTLSPEVRDWLSQNFDHTMARQRSQADTAKLLVTFALGIAATLVATALQVGDVPNRLDLWATFVLGAAFLVALLVILLDRVQEPDRRWLMDRLARTYLPTEAVLDKLAELEGDRHEHNDGVVSSLKVTSMIQLLLSGVAGVLAAVSMLRLGT